MKSTSSRGILYRFQKGSPFSSVARNHAVTEPAARRAAQRRQAPKNQPTNPAVDRRPRTSSPTLRRYDLNEEGVPTRSDKPHPHPHVHCSRALPCIGGYPPCFNVSASARGERVGRGGRGVVGRRQVFFHNKPSHVGQTVTGRTARQPRRSNGDRPHIYAYLGFTGFTPQVGWLVRTCPDPQRIKYNLNPTRRGAPPSPR